MPSALRLPLTVLAAALLASLPARADDHAFSEKFERTHSFRADGEVTLANTNGSVVIKTWDRNEVRVEGEKRAKTEEELKLIRVDIDLSDTQLAIKTDFPKRRSGWFSGERVRGHVTFTLTVPATARLREIGTTNGSIAIKDVRGPVHARSVNGQLKASGLAADTSLETVNGTIDAAFTAVAQGQKISTRTVNGSTTIGLPADASVDFSARSVNGSITCDLPLRLGDKGRRSLSGVIGNGGATLESETVNGSIRVKKL